MPTLQTLLMAAGWGGVLLLALWCPLLGQCAEGASENCSLPRSGGPCRGRFQRWYFDREDGECKKFIYGGCGGNANNFDSERDCMRNCSRGDEQMKVCLQSAKRGPCRNFRVRWHFDNSKSECVPFVYGGCHANGNNFDDQNTCLGACLPASSPQRRCLAEAEADVCESWSSPSFAFDLASGKCKLRRAGRCPRRGGDFKNVSECAETCLHQDGLLNYQASVCSQPLIKSTCHRRIKRYGFSVAKGRCVEFVYSGCGGNDNNFPTETECVMFCGDQGNKTRTTLAEGLLPRIQSNRGAAARRDPVSDEVPSN